MTTVPTCESPVRINGNGDLIYEPCDDVSEYHITFLTDDGVTRINLCSACAVAATAAPEPADVLPAAVRWPWWIGGEE